MILDSIAMWVFSATFATLAVVTFLQILSSWSRPLEVVSLVLHLLMASGMSAMVWPWWMHIPTLPQMLVFGAGSVWFLVLAWVPLLRLHTVGLDRWRGAAHHYADAVMMIAMLWMTAAMHVPTEAAGAGSGPGSPTPGHAHVTLPEWMAAPGVVLTAALLVCGAVYLVNLIVRIEYERRLRAREGGLVIGAAMSLGMSAMSWVMLVAS